MVSGCYVYGILNRFTPLPPDLTGFEGASLFAVPCRGISAAASCLGTPAPPHSTPAHLLIHEAIVEALGLVGPVLPVRFGTVLADPEQVERAMAERYTGLVTDLARLGDKVEMGLTVLWGPDQSGEEEPQLADPDSVDVHPAATGPGVEYLRARMAEDRKESMVRSRGKALARGIDEVMRFHSLERRFTAPPSSRLAMRASYLLQPVEVRAFQQLFEALRLAHPELRFLLTGPWPPYSFVKAAEAQLPVSEDWPTDPLLPLVGSELLGGGVHKMKGEELR